MNHKAFHAKPFAAYRDGKPVPLAPVLDAVARDVKLISEVAEWHLRSDRRLLDDLTEHTCQANEAGRLLGITVPKHLLHSKTGASRYDKLLCDRVVREARSWKARSEVTEGTSSRYVNRGWRRTARNTIPTELVPKYSLSSCDTAFAKITNDPLNDGFISLRLVVEGEWHTLEFPLDTARFSSADKITLPDVRVSPDGEPVFTFTAAYRQQRVPISERFVIGVDAGRTTYVTAVVWDTVNGDAIHTSTLSQRVHSLHNSVEATRLQVTSLRKRGRFAEADQHRRANKRKRRELAILAAQELADLAFRFGNAVIAFEDLSWIANTMANGRWNRGELVRWTTHFHELNGGRITHVNAHNTSQKCHCCGSPLSFPQWKIAVCPVHGTMDRDENASCNIALRAVRTAFKMAATRKRSTRLTNRRVRRTPPTRESLRFPGRDRTKSSPTPKRPAKKRVEVNGEFVCSSTGDDGRTVVEDVKLESESLHGTVRQHDHFRNCNRLSLL